MPIPLAIPLIIAAASAAIKAYSDYQSGQNQEAQDRRNALLAEFSAQDAEQRGAVQASRVQERGNQILGREKTAYASSGVDSGSGSTLTTYADTKMNSELDALTARNNAAREAWGYRTQGLNYQKQANIDEQRGNLNAASSVIGGVGDVFSWMGRNK